MKQNISLQIKNRINGYEDGNIFMTSDFSDIANITTIRKCLGRMTDSGDIKRIIDGVYEKPKFSKLLGEYLPADPEKVAYAIAKNYHWTIAPCGDIALNKLGLSTQVPVVWSYISDGPYREYEWDNVKLKYKHKTNREISFLSEKTILLVESIRTLGRERIDNEVIGIMKNCVIESEKKKILSEAKNSSEWIYTIIRKVCDSDE